MWEMISEIFVSIAPVLTFAAVAFAAWEIRQSDIQARVTFEDNMNQQYREFSMALPVDVLLGGEPAPECADRTRELIYNYLDLVNEQTYLRSRKRIFNQTWVNWRDGIASNLEKPAFKKIYDEVKGRSGFNYLETLVDSGFSIDPIKFPKDLRPKNIV